MKKRLKPHVILNILCGIIWIAILLAAFVFHAISLKAMAILLLISCVTYAILCVGGTLFLAYLSKKRK